MQYSKTGLELTESFEGCRLEAYRDIKGVLTVGFGHTGDDVMEGLVWTQEQAYAQLLKDTQHAQDIVNRLVTIELTQPAFDSLVDFVFNVGSGNFESSTLLKLLNAGNLEAASDEIDKWDHASGQVVAGLLRRREAETKEFNS